MITSNVILLLATILAVAMLMAITIEVSGIADVVRKWWKGEGAFIPRHKEDKGDADY